MTEIERTCRTCADNDFGLCDRKGILVEDDDSCEKWNSQLQDSEVTPDG